MKKIALLMTVLAVLAGCAELPSASKTALVSGETSAKPVALQTVTASKGSLVPAAQVNPAVFRGLFEERRAVRVGDTLTVLLNETTRASKDIGTNARRNSSNNVNMGFNLSTGSTSPATTINGGVNNNGNLNFDSKGGSSASNQFSGTITVTVLEVLSNGNLNVAGEKRLAVGHEEEVIRFGGIVSPSNLQGNSVLSSQVADARIEYRGVGITDQVQIPGILTKLFTRYSPN
ncbi:MAG: flagellar basal body L-ring protein FlgH [Betaproteobacteria bacterium]|jgi:flagellar L-ring protein precursor FlgH|nr:flagellar basal body L-ring protein FlgH [Burkholderiales bacterium]NBX13581.1 flagellar basal body L-ring protein FlgH [Betaproteobacteria bacterium]NBX90205.1 flagellar basal body L-ring protein FlgH [Betaproteobacteria bacterium]